MTGAVVWGVLLALALLVAVLVICRILIDAGRQRAEVERIERAKLDQLLADNPVSVWAPGVDRLVKLCEREHRPLPDALVGYSDRSTS